MAGEAVRAPGTMPTVGLKPGKGFQMGSWGLQPGVPGPWVHSWGITALFLCFCMLCFSSPPLTTRRSWCGQHSACPLRQWETFPPSPPGANAAALFTRGDAPGLQVISSGYQAAKRPEFI